MNATVSVSSDQMTSNLGRTTAAWANSVYLRGVKRAFDLALVLLTAPIWVPVVAALAALVALDGASPFFFQDRVGRDGRKFRMVKLRTMVPDAEEKLGKLLAADPELAEEWRVSQKLRHDPRVTAIGRLLRRTSLDELPQLWNVMTADMSLVGPRPMLVSQQDLYPGTAYYRFRPGITGAWQIHGRNESSFSGRAAYDNFYARKSSFGVDFSILMRTVNVVLRGSGV
ncbi:sugar transferase [Tropicimonas sp. IMCC34043]|uniref:sugar transferase n=1 Tax=Tropicimonas sp. IMCC34043 TaxID=2248760 RepID=UPI000E22CB77|nr:sugar transferase [Tropicimonas sp. IMCC34043]